MKVLCVMLLVIGCAVGAMAQFRTAKELADDCHTKAELDAHEADTTYSVDKYDSEQMADIACVAYIRGALEALLLWAPYRLNECKSVDAEQVHELFIRYAAAHPEDWNDGAVLVLTRVLVRNGLTTPVPGWHPAKK